VLGAAMRLMSISHSDVQGILFRIHQVVAEQAEVVEGRDWTAMQSFTPELDIASLVHRFDDIRMFAS
jgi:urease accessory protein UreF